jgi:hypothetical protein
LPPTSSQRVVPPPVSYQDIVSSLARSTVESQGTRTRPARRRSGRGRPPMPRLPAAAFRRPATLAQPGSQLTQPSLQITMSTDPDTREVRIRHNVNLPSLGNEDC